MGVSQILGARARAAPQSLSLCFIIVFSVHIGLFLLLKCFGLNVSCHCIPYSMVFSPYRDIAEAQQVRRIKMGLRCLVVI